MSALAWFAAALVAVGAYPAYRFVRRSWRFRATRTVVAVVAGQLVGLVLVALGVLLLPRPDLVGMGWYVLLLAATVLPLAIGDLVQSADRRALRVVTASAAAALTLGVVGVAAAPALAQPMVAGDAIPVTEKTLADGYQLAVRIPPTASGFQARDAHLFVPPGWLRDPSSTRPVVEMMMGQPGSPTLGATLDALHSLGDDRLNQAPFVLVVDQLGALDQNPPCADVPGSKLVTYLAKDVPAWIEANLPVSRERAQRVIAGFSHGGECAAYLGASFPQTWGAVVDISGPDKPGEHRPGFTRDRYFGGDQVAYEKTWPANVLASRDYPQPTVGIFVAGKEDPTFRVQVEDTATAAENAGWKVTYWAVPGAGHSSPTLTTGLATAYNQLIGSWLRTDATSAGERFLCVPDQAARACALTQAASVAGTVAIADLSALAVFLAITLSLFFARRGVSLRRARPSLDD